MVKALVDLERTCVDTDGGGILILELYFSMCAPEEFKLLSAKLSLKPLLLCEDFCLFAPSMLLLELSLLRLLLLFMVAPYTSYSL